jgi:hypothetical protein
MQRRNLKDKECFNRELWRKTVMSLSWGKLCIHRKIPIYRHKHTNQRINLISLTFLGFHIGLFRNKTPCKILSATTRVSCILNKKSRTDKKGQWSSWRRGAQQNSSSQKKKSFLRNIKQGLGFAPIL